MPWWGWLMIGVTTGALGVFVYCIRIFYKMFERF